MLMIYLFEKIEKTLCIFLGNGNILKLNVNDEEVNFFMIADWGGIFLNDF
jgi:hypothetical protein